MSVAEIKDAVNKLPAQERLRLLAELCDWPDDEWDRQMKNDAAASKFAGLNEEAARLQDYGQFLRDDPKEDQIYESLR